MSKPTTHLRNALLALAAPVLLAACGGGDPEQLTFDLNISGGAIAGESVLEAKQNDTVTILVSTDEPITFHLHGYDIEKEAKPGAPATLEFTADATGSFPFTMHAASDSHEKDPEDGHENGEGGCTLDLAPGIPSPHIAVTAAAGGEPGAIHVSVTLENFELGVVATNDSTLVGHWHLSVNGEEVGMYTTPETTVHLKEPGNYEIMASLSGPDHCMLGINAMTSFTVHDEADGNDDEPDHGHDDEPEEVTLGRLEVQPR